MCNGSSGSTSQWCDMKTLSWAFTVEFFHLQSSMCTSAPVSGHSYDHRRPARQDWNQALDNSSCSLWFLLKMVHRTSFWDNVAILNQVECCQQLNLMTSTTSDTSHSFWLPLGAASRSQFAFCSVSFCPFVSVLSWRFTTFVCTYQWSQVPSVLLFMHINCSDFLRHINTALSLFASIQFERCSDYFPLVILDLNGINASAWMLVYWRRHFVPTASDVIHQHQCLYK